MAKARNMPTIARATVLNLADVIADRPQVAANPDPRVRIGRGQNLAPADTMDPSGLYAGYLNRFRVPAKRLQELQWYDYLEREIADVRRALDAMATMAVTGNLAGGGAATYTLRFRNKPDTYPEEVKRRFARMQDLFGRISYSTLRTMTKYGSYMPQIIPGILEDRRLGVAQVNPVPPGTIYRNIKPDGTYDVDKYWIQIIDGRVVGSANRENPWEGTFQNNGIPQWVLPHFAVWSNVVSATETLVYGTSVLQPFGPIGLKVHACLDAVVVARLTRAAMRYVWKIDISDIMGDPNAIRLRVAKWKAQLSRSSSLINDAQNVDSYEKAAVPDSDFFVPSAKNSGWGVDTLDGDTNLSRVQDIELLFRVYFGALGVPADYLGHVSSQGGRSNLSQIDIQFARTVRNLQMFGAAGLEHLMLVDLILGGWDPADYPFDVVPPQIGARDDLLQQQIRTLQAAVISSLSAAGMDLTVNPRWILETFLGMDEELEGLDPDQVDSLFKEIDNDKGQPEAAVGKRVRELLESPEFAENRANLNMLLRQSEPSIARAYWNQQPSLESLRRQVRILPASRS